VVTIPSLDGSNTTVARLRSAVRSRKREAAKNCAITLRSASPEQLASVRVSSETAIAVFT
jgi:hypothetical protein